MYLLIRILYAVLSRLPLSVLLFLGRNLGRLMYYLLPSRRRVAFTNCKAMNLEGDHKKIVKESFKQTFCSYIESFYVKNMDSKFMDEMVDVEYRGEKPDTIGCFMVSAHFGAWEVLAYSLPNKLGMRGATVARKLKNKKVDAYIQRQRSNSEIGYIHHRNATEAIRDYMEKGQTIGVLLDHSSMAKDSMAVPFFGMNTTFIKGALLLSVRKDYPFCPVFVLRKKKGYRLLVYPLMYPNTELKQKDRAYDMALRINKIFEEVIREHPEQWYLIHKRFKRIADEEGNFTKSIY